MKKTHKIESKFKTKDKAYQVISLHGGGYGIISVTILQINIILKEDDEIGKEEYYVNTSHDHSYWISSDELFSTKEAAIEDLKYYLNFI